MEAETSQYLRNTHLRRPLSKEKIVLEENILSIPTNILSTVSLSQRGRKPSNQNNNKVITLIAKFRGVRMLGIERVPRERKRKEGEAGEESEEEVMS